MELFILANCFNNYEIVASRVFKTSVENSTPWLGKIKTFFDDTPFALYATNMNPNVYVPPRSKQYRLFIILIGLLAVCLARISTSLVVFINQGVVPIASFASLFAIANTLGRPTVQWSDDMRLSWGSTSDPLTIASNPLFWKDILASSIPSTAPDARNLNQSPNLPVMGQDVLCHPGNTLSDKISRSLQTFDPLVASSSSSWKNLIALGNVVIQKVEKDSTGWNLLQNPSLFTEIESVVLDHQDLLSEPQRQFVKLNTLGGTPTTGGVPNRPYQAKTKPDKGLLTTQMAMYLQSLASGGTGIML